jgi:hypothetical protein
MVLFLNAQATAHVLTYDYEPFYILVCYKLIYFLGIA